MAHPIDTTDLIIFRNYTKGNCRNYAGNEFHGALAGGEGFVQTEGGLSYRAGASYSTDSCAFLVDPRLNLYQKAFTVALSMVPTGRSGVKTTAFSAGYAGIFRLSAAWPNTTCHCFFLANAIYIGDGVDNKGFTFAAGEYKDIDTLIITKGAGIVKAKMYLNGIIHSESLGTFDCADVNPTIFDFGRTFALNDESNANYKAFLLYLAEKDADQVAAIHQSLIRLKTPHTGTRRKYFTLGSAHANSSPGLVSAWNMRTGKITDVNGVNHGPIPSGIIQKSLPWGESGLLCPGNKNIDVGAINLGTTHSISAWLRYNADGDEAFGGVDANEYALGRFAPSLAYSPFAGNFVSFPAPSLGIYNHFLLSRDNLNVTLYQNGVLVSTKVLAANDVFVFRYFGAEAGLVAFYALNGEYGPVALYNVAKDEAFARSEYNRVAKLRTYHEDFSSAPCTYAAIGAGRRIPGTEIEVVSGTWKVVYDATLRKNVLQCVTTGVIAVAIPQGNAEFGTWKWKWYFPNVSSYQRYFMCMSDIKNVSHWSHGNAYGLSVFTLGFLALIKSPTGLTPGYTANGFVSSATWYDVEFARTTEKSTTFKLDNVICPVVVGTNPYTDAYTPGSKYAVASFYAGDQISEITKLFGVPL